LNFEIEPKEKTIIICRTGSEKFTNTLSSIRILESKEGKI